VHVLVVDDDKGTRFVLSRLLTQHFGLSVTECVDGLEALRMLSKRRFHFVILDTDMPTMSGIEVLECMREAADTRHVPVIALSGPRDRDAIQSLLKLGVSDCILTPPRADKVVAKVQRLLQLLPRPQEAAEDGAALRLSPSTPALVVDGSLDFRFALVNELQSFGTVHEADSGAAALARFRDLAVGLVFVGQDLGVVGPEMLVRRLRRLRPDGPLRVVGMVDDMSKVPQDVFDAVLQRTFLPTMLRAALRPYVDMPGPLNALRARVPDIVELAAAAASQAFAMMFETEVSAEEAEPDGEATANASVGMDVLEKFHLTIATHFTHEGATAVAAKLYGTEPADLTDQDRSAMAGEVCTLIARRVHASLDERQIPSACHPAVLSGPAPVAAIAAADGWIGRFTLAISGSIWMSLVVTPHTGSVPQGSPGRPLAASRI
jgi:CheY-like chemotaxis protein